MARLLGPLVRVVGRRSLSSATASYAVAPYRDLVGASAAEVEAWAAADVSLHAEMRKRVPAALKHNGEEAFDRHLVGVQSVLRSWGAPVHVTDAALFHSIYGTEGFQGFALPLSERGAIAELIGPRAERLAWIFCMVDRATVDATVLLDDDRSPSFAPSFRARAEIGAFEIPTRSRAEWLDFLALSLADWLEQVEGAATKALPRPVGDGLVWDEGEAWGYRRRAYAKMAAILEAEGPAWVRDVAPRMYAEVFAREPEATRGVTIPKTPPMSRAALDAARAVEAAALDFDDLEE